MCQRIAAENTVQRIEEAGAKSQQRAGERHRYIAGKDAAHQRTTQNGQGQRQQFFLRHGLFPQQGGQHHHDGGSGVQQNGGHCQRAQLLAGKVTHREQQNADHTGAEKVFQMFPSDTEHAAVTRGENARQQRHAAEVPHHHDRSGREASRHQAAVPQTDDAPQSRRQQNTGIGVPRCCFFAGFVHAGVNPPIPRRYP